MLRVVLDLNVVVSSLIEPRGPSGQALRAVFAGRLIPVVCPRLLAEAAGVCTRPRHRSRFSLAEAEALLDGLEARAEIAPDPAWTGPLTPDPDDDYLIALARETGCDAIVSGDRHRTEFAGPPPVWRPAELLARLEPEG